MKCKGIRNDILTK